MGSRSGPGGAVGGRDRAGVADAPRLGVRTVTAADLSHVKFNDRPISESFADARSHEIRKERIRQAFRAGNTNLGELEVAVRKDGSMNVESGRHRIEVLREPEFRDLRVKVRFSRGR